MTDTDISPRAIQLGVLAILATCFIWGLSPLYYALIPHLPVTDIMAHRVIWSLVFFLAILVVQRRLPVLRQALTNKSELGWLIPAAFLVSINWTVFIYSIHVQRVTQSSLGYYIYPLVAVLLGYVIFRERLSALQWLAVGLATIAVVVLTSGIGELPWISLLLATSFAGYGVMKKKVSAGPVVSVTVEVVILTPIALIWLLAFARNSDLDPGTLGLLILSGPLTAGPLVLFSFAAKRLRYTTIGLVLYLNPTLQFLVAVLAFAEPFGTVHLIAFPLIWTALGVYSASTILQDRRARRASTSASTVSTEL